MILNMPLEYLRELKTVVALLTFEHLKTQQLVNIQYSPPCTFPSLHIIFSLSTPDTFFHIFVYVYIYWRVIILVNCIGASQLKKSNVSLKVRHA